MPRKYPSYQTCHRRFKAWHESGVLKRVMNELFGEASAELCGMMETRMRIHISPEAKGSAHRCGTRGVVTAGALRSGSLTVRRCLRYSASQDLSSALHDETSELNLLNQKNRPHEKIVGRFFIWTAKLRTTCWRSAL